MERIASIFSLTIHNNEDIIDTERMRYFYSLFIELAKNCGLRLSFQPKFYSSALQELNRRFGNPQNVVGALTKELEAFQRPATNDHAALITFAALKRKLVQKFASHGFSAELNATYPHRIAQDKLPNPIKLRWTDKSRSYSAPRLDGLAIQSLRTSTRHIFFNQ